MRIPQMVEEVRHFVAAHEVRNSFPLESISFLDMESLFGQPISMKSSIQAFIRTLGGVIAQAKAAAGSALRRSWD
jgi:hypothetical protein